MGLVVGALMTLSANDRVRPGRSAASSPREDDILEVLKLAGHGPVTYDYMVRSRASIWGLLPRLLKSPGNHRGWGAHNEPTRSLFA